MTVQPLDVSRPLIVTSDETLLDELLRLSAAAGVTPLVASDVGAARRAWAGAPLVVVGADLCAALATAAPARRSAVLVATVGDVAANVWPSAVALHADRVIVLPAQQELAVDAFANCLDSAGADAPVLSVVGGSGGVGASCLAGGLAMLAARSRRSTLLVDADPFGGGIDLVLGAESQTGLRWPDLAATEGRISGASLRRALPASGELSVLSWDRGALHAVAPDAMSSVLSAGRRSHDLVVVDLPRQLDDLAAEALGRSVLTVLVVGGDVRSVAAANRVLCVLRELASDVRLAVRVGGGRRLGADDVSRALGVPVATRVSSDRRLTSTIDDALGPITRRRSPVLVAARQLLDCLDRSAAR